MSTRSNPAEYARGVYAAVTDTRDDKRVYDVLCAQDEKLARLRLEAFSDEFLFAKLALVAASWEKECSENGIADENISRVFSKVALDVFASPDMVKSAAVFSEYMFCWQDKSEASPLLSIAAMVFRRLGINATHEKEQGDSVINPAFEVFAGILESLRSAFEAQFAEYLLECTIEQSRIGEKDGHERRR